MDNHTLNQEIYLEPNPDGESYEITGSDVQIHTCRIYERTRDSSKVRSRAIIDYRWETKVYDGRLVAVHKDGEYLAYVLHSRNTCNVRVMNRTTKARTLIKTFVGQAVDLVWSFSSSPLLLATSDEAGNVVIYAIEEHGTGHEMNVTKFLRVERSLSVAPRQPPHRLTWCPFIPDGVEQSLSGPDDEHCRLLAVFHGTRVDILNIDKIVRNCGNETTFMAADAFISSKEIESDITAVAIAPDATALALSSYGGDVMFYIMESDGEIKPAQTWKPHKGRPVTSIIFLDNFLATGQSEDTYWKFVLTSSDGNRELKLWNCENWDCMSTLHIDPPTTHLDNTALELTSDWSSQFIFLTDIERKSLYTMEIGATPTGRVRFSSFTEFPLLHPALSVAIVRAGPRKFHPLSPGVANENEEPGEHDYVNMIGVQIRLFAVNPKSLLELDIRFVPPKTDEVNESILSVSSNKLEPLRDELSDLNIDLPTPPVNITGRDAAIPLVPEFIDFGAADRESASPPSGSPNNETPTRELEILEIDPRISASPSSQEVSKILANPLVPVASVEEEASGVDDLANVEDVVEEHGTPMAQSSILDLLAAASSEKWKVNDEPRIESAQVSPDYGLLVNSLSKWHADLAVVSSSIARQEEALQQLKVLVGSQQSMWDAISRLAQDSDRQGKENLQCLQQYVADLQPDQFRQGLTRMVEDVVHHGLDSTVKAEMRHAVIPTVNDTMKLLMDGFQVQVSKQLETTDAVLRDSIGKMMKSKEVVDTIGQAAAKCANAEAQNAYRESFLKVIAPSFETAVRSLFTQVNDTFQRGTKEYLDQLNRQSALVLHSMEEWRKSLNGHLSSFSETLKSSSDQQLTVVQANTERQFGSLTQRLQESLHGSIRSIVKEEVAKAVADGQQVLNDTVMRAIRSHAPTPVNAPVNDHRQQVLGEIDACLKRGQLNTAFQHALQARDVTIVNHVCQRVDPIRLFTEGPCQLHQPIILSLLQQLTADLSNFTELKLRYMQEAVPSLDMKAIADIGGPAVLRQIYEKVDSFLQTKPGPHDRRGKTVLMLLSSLIAQQSA